jgi:hypothetical protein
MSINIITGFDSSSREQLDKRSGPYASTTAALAALNTNKRAMGLPIYVITNATQDDEGNYITGTVQTYSFTGGIADADLTLQDVVGITAQQAADIEANNAKVGITTQQAADIEANNAKAGYTESLVSANASVVANTAKVSYDGVSSAKLGGIEAGAEVNTINSITTSEPTGSDAVLNVVSLTQAEYDAGTKIATTFYIITD